MAEDIHTLICVAGKSGSGKDTIVNKICERTGAKQLISYTTRNRRDGEGETHIFVNEDEYQKMFDDGQIAAYTEIAGNKYWSTVNQILESDFYVVDPFGIKTLRDMNIPNLRIVVVYIKTDDDIREDRTINIRGDDKVTFRKRCFAENNQFREFIRDEAYDYCISNNSDLAKSYTILRYISLIEGAIKTGGDVS